MIPSYEGKGELLRREVVTFFEKAERFDETRRPTFASWLGINPRVVDRVFPNEEWETLRSDWLLGRLRKAMLEVYGRSKVREEFNVSEILAVCRVSRKVFERVVGTEWREMSKTLPTLREKVLADLAHLVEINTPVNELTAKMLFEYSGYRPGDGDWIFIPLRAAKIELAARQAGQAVDIPDGDNIFVFQGGYVDLDSPEWDLKLKNGLIRRDDLRPDVAEVAWTLLKAYILERRIALRTVFFNFRCFIKAGELLGAEVPEVREATLEAVQRAWVGYEGTRTNLRDSRAALGRLFVALHNLAEDDSSIDREEMLKIAVWLKTKAKLPRKESGGDFLSENELSQVVTACLIDIKAGTEFVKSGPDLLTMSTRVNQPINAVPVIDWAIALVVLVMAFTGMRRQSVVGLLLSDWMQMRSELSAIAWHHSKNGEESLVVTPALVTRLLDSYVRHTEKVRTALGTRRVFLTGGPTGVWTPTLSNTALYIYLSNFVIRHGILRDGKPVKLNSTVLRRTYATHQLHKGRSLVWIQAQLGHKKIENTKNYAQFDLYEHPTQVRGPLDAWGLRVLALWHRPANLEALSPDERAALFSPRESGTEREPFPGHEGNGLSEKAPAAWPHSCSTCEHLVTGPEYVDQWEREHDQREARLKLLESDPSAADRLENEFESHGRFMKNYLRVKEEVGK